MTRRFAILLCLAVGAFAPANAQQLRGVPPSRPHMQLSFAPIVREVAPAVVNVYGARLVSNAMRGFFDDPMFRRFFGEGGPDGLPRERVQSSLGSGVIVTAEGLVVTNYHVIANVDEVRVQLGDRREFEAEIVLRDERTDLAVLRLKAEGQRFPVVPLGDSDALEVGDLVLAIGNPFGVGQTVTSGIISALARTQVARGVNDYQFFIQTDAAINPGNSGGALVGMDGRLVGINTAIYSRSGGNIGIGFAIPASMVRIVVQSAEAGGQTVRRPYFGARLQAVTPEIAESLGLPRPTGALVVSVEPRTPAERAGLRRNDVIVAVEGQEVSDPSAFGFRFVTRPLGGTARLDVLRGNHRETVNVPLETAPETRPREAWAIDLRVPFAGATVGNLSPALAEELRLAADSEGVAVIEVRQGSPAMQLGLRRGDIIRAVNGDEMRSVRQLRGALAARVRVWQFQVERDGRRLMAQVRGSD